MTSRFTWPGHYAGSGRIARLGLIAVAALGAAGCTQIRSHQGYIIDTDLVNSVQPGVDNRQSVLQTLGKPTFSAQFDKGDWYYLARDSKNYGFRNPHAITQIALDISFDPAGNVTTIRRSGLDQVNSVHMYGKTTPTLGRKRGFFQDLFGNIGTVGAGGGPGSSDGGGSPNGGGRGRNTP
ncbi:outer membrane protein assembly factor BamE [uncultured Sphingomonas sp.]|uniref:outer membrane protein assembly factor BamE n=1 Tax=uncultured Sphingomonas sp. TaxID=158754 RepID=UPI0035CBC435